MWKGIVANYRFNKGYSYITRTKQTISGGKPITSDGDTYTNMPIAFIPEDLKPKWTPEGYKYMGWAAAVIPARFFTKREITPHVDDMIESPSSTRYRILEISNYSKQPFMGVYHVLLKREEYDGSSRST